MDKSLRVELSYRVKRLNHPAARARPPSQKRRLYEYRMSKVCGQMVTSPRERQNDGHSTSSPWKLHVGGPCVTAIRRDHEDCPN
jgi:hypothetical protein